MAITCKQCDGANVQIAMWVSVNESIVSEDREFFPVDGDFGSPGNYDCQWCCDCQDHVQLKFD